MLEERMSASTSKPADQTHDRLDLRSQLSEIARIPGWIEELALRYSIPEDLRFAMDLCLEEVFANTIIYGYRSEDDHLVSVDFINPGDGVFVFVVDDDAPKFNPLGGPELPPLRPGEEIRIGGQGLRLLRQFAHTLEYEPTATGNRLRIGFSTAGASVRTT
jgi:serine/threonine-protein kinase RsbW